MIDFGDGSIEFPILTITAVDGDVIYTEGHLTHTYEGGGSYVATMGSCCRLSGSSGHVNNGDLSYQVHTLVELAGANSSPSIAVAPVVFCPTSGNCSFAFSGSGADPGNHLVWRFAAPSETGDSFFVQPGPPYAPNAATIDPGLGRVTWNTSGATLSEPPLPTYYSTQVIAEEINGSGETVSDAAADFFIALDDDHSVQPDCEDTDSNGSVDNDADGLCDNWETDGIDSNHDHESDVFLPEANPNHPDIYIEIDYMKGRKPQAAALEDVADAFAAHGIALHFFVDEEVPFHEDLGFGPSCSLWSCPEGTVDFDSIKASYFGAPGDRASVNHEERLEALRFAYHYALYADQLGGDHGSSGIAELPGNDFVITLGDSSWRTYGGSGPPKRRDEAGTLMHEFGHNLSLRHGGGDSVNCKPNYLSVMNYTRQTTGFITAQLDYSDRVLPPLDESFLNEAVGIQGPSGAQVVHGPGVHRVSSSSGPIDWNGVPGYQSGVEADVNYISDKPGCEDPSPGDSLGGWDDWDNLALAFQATADFADGVHASVLTQEPEISAADFADEDSDGDGVPNIQDECPTEASSDESGCEPPANETSASSATPGISAQMTKEVQPPPPAGTASIAGKPKVKGNKVLLRLRCAGAGACRGVVKLTTRLAEKAKAKGKGEHKKGARTIVIGKARYSVAAGKRATVHVKLTGKGKALLRHAGKHGLKVKLTGSGIKSRMLKIKSRSRNKRRRRKHR